LAVSGASGILSRWMGGLWRGGLRNLLPWIAGGVLAWFLVLHWVPGRWCEFRRTRAEAARLSELAPRPEILRERLAGAVRDSVRSADLRRAVASRQAGGSDPSSQVASLVVPRLEAAGLVLRRVSARTESGEVLLSLSVAGGWKQFLTGFGSLDSMPLSWKVRRLAVRPADGFRLNGDVVVAVPAAPEDAR
jgi:hypothetical protein